MVCFRITGHGERTCRSGPTRPQFTSACATGSVRPAQTPAIALAARRRMLCGWQGFGRTAAGVSEGRAACAADSACASRKLPRPPRPSAARASPAHGLAVLAASVAACVLHRGRAGSCLDVSRVLADWHFLLPLTALTAVTSAHCGYLC